MLTEITSELPNLTPRQIVDELDKYIIGQAQAKRAVAVALRNRRRRQLVEGEIRDEILPKNILMKGPTGVGKTEIARRLAKLAHAPFIKVEATKFTEVGYVGRDVESMIRDLVDIAVNMVKNEQAKLVSQKAREVAIQKILDLYHPPLKPAGNLSEEEKAHILERHQKHHDRLRQELLDGNLDEEKVELEVTENASPSISVFNGTNMEEMGFQIKDMMSSLFGQGKTKNKYMKIKEALPRIQAEEEQHLIDMDQVVQIAIERVENSGIVFLDEIDKIAGASGRGAGGPDVSRGGVQRDLLPIIEGSTVSTKHGMVKTDHILFIAAGAFHDAKPADLLPELQGRLPVQVELESLTEEDFCRILVEPANSLISQNQALLNTENVQLEFSDEGIKQIAKMAFRANEKTENLGARRLQSVMEQLLEDVFFNASEMSGQTVTINRAFVDKYLLGGEEKSELSKYIL